MLPTFNVVATMPLGGGEIDVAKIPAAVWQTGAEDIQTYYDTTVTQVLARQAPGVTVGNVSGNDFQPDVSYRGFDATPVTGEAERLAVYQNGARINVRRHGQRGSHRRGRDRQDDDRRRRSSAARCR